MTIGTEPAPLSYNGDDATVNFPITWLYFAKSHVVATLRDAADAETLWVLGTDYTLTAANVEAGGTLTATTAPATGETLVIELDPPNTQDKSLPLGGPFPSTNVEDGLDIAAQRDSKLETLFDRALHVPKTDTQSGSELEIPIDSDRASKFLAFDASGDPIASTGTGADSGLRGDLGNETDSLLGANLVGYTDSLSGPTYLKTVSDIINGVEVSLFRFIARTKHSGIQAGTNTDDLTTDIQTALDAIHDEGRGGIFSPAGTFNITGIDWPGNNITLRGAGSAYSYNTANTPRTIFKQIGTETVMFRMAQTGTSEDRKGNHLVDFEVDGNSVSNAGINCSGANIIERVRVRRCMLAGIRLDNFTNSTRIVRCGSSSNSGWGLQVIGVSSTTFSVTDSVFSLNTLGGIDLEAGAFVSFKNVVSESNTGPGLRIFRPVSHTGALHTLSFENCWFEDNASATPFFTLTMDAFDTTELRAIRNVEFKKCRINPSSATRKHLSFGNVDGVYFKRCSFDASTESDALTLTSVSRDVGWIDSASTYGGLHLGLSSTQLNNALAQGTRCFVSEENALTANANTTAVGNVGTGEDNLMTYALPADTLHSNGRGIRITAWGTNANNSNAKTLKLYFGTTVIGTQSLTVSQAGVWQFDAVVLSTGTDTQDFRTLFFQAGTTEIRDLDVGTATEDDGAAITIKCTGEATTDDDIVQEGMLVERLS